MVIIFTKIVLEQDSEKQKHPRTTWHFFPQQPLLPILTDFGLICVECLKSNITEFQIWKEHWSSLIYLVIFTQIQSEAQRC